MYANMGQAPTLPNLQDKHTICFIYRSIYINNMHIEIENGIILYILKVLNEF
jgi:hypothetical protein